MRYIYPDEEIKSYFIRINIRNRHVTIKACKNRKYFKIGNSHDIDY